MSDDKKGVSYEGQLDLSSVQGYLKALMAGFKGGTIYVQSGAEVLALQPESTVTLELEARRKKDKQSLKLEFKWESAPAGDDATGHLVISDKEPEPVLVEEEDA